MSDFDAALQAARASAQEAATKEQQSKYMKRAVEHWLHQYPPFATVMELNEIPQSHVEAVNDYIRHLGRARMTPLWIRRGPDGQLYENVVNTRPVDRKQYHHQGSGIARFTTTSSKSFRQVRDEETLQTVRNERLLRDWHPVGEVRLITWRGEYDYESAPPYTEVQLIVDGENYWCRSGSQFRTVEEFTAAAIKDLVERGGQPAQ